MGKRPQVSPHELGVTKPKVTAFRQQPTHPNPPRRALVKLRLLLHAFGPRAGLEETYNRGSGNGMTKTVRLTEPELAGVWDVESLDDGRLLLTRHVGPSVEELAERAGGERLSSEEFQHRWGHLPRDGEG